MTQGIPESVRAFVVRHIDSVEQLEVLLFMRTHSTSSWHADDLARELRIDPGSARIRLDDLRSMGLVEAEPGSEQRFRYAAGHNDLAIAGLAQCYQTHRVSIITLIFSKPSEKLQGFADAFRIRREDKDG